MTRRSRAWLRCTNERLPFLTQVSMGKGLSQLFQEPVQVDNALDNDSEHAPMRIQRKSGKFASSGKQGKNAEKAKAMNKADAKTDIDALMGDIDVPRSEAEDDSEAKRERASLPLPAFAIY